MSVTINQLPLKKYFYKILIVFAGILFLSATYQETIWLDEDLQETNQKEAKYYTIGNKKEGTKTYFYTSRTIYRKVNFAKGKLNGKFYEYYRTGELRETGTYLNGLREGNWKEFYKSGKIKKKGKYEKGNKVGIWKTFYKNVY